MTENLIDHLTEQEINSLKKLSSFDLNSIYYDNTIILKDYSTALSDTCISFKGNKSWLSIGNKTTTISDIAEYGPLRVFENEFPRNHPNAVTLNSNYIPNTKEEVKNQSLTLKHLFVYSVTETNIDLSTMTYDCGLEIQFKENCKLFIYSAYNRTFALRKSFDKQDLIYEYTGFNLAELTARQII